MRQPDDLDIEIKHLEPFIDKAADGLLTFYVPAERGFLRSTLQPRQTSPTASARALFALAEYVRFLQEHDGDDRKRSAKMTRVMKESFGAWILDLADPKRREEIFAKSDNQHNFFTDSHLLMAIAMTPRFEITDLAPRNPTDLLAYGRELRDSLVQHVKKSRGGKIHPDDPTTHDFITLHALRAIDAFAPIDGTARADALIQALRPRVERDVLARLGYHSAGIDAEFDPAELLFTAALLERCVTPSWEKLLRRAVEVVVGDQTPDGAWVGSRVVAYQKQGLLHVASYEVGLTLSFIAASAVHRGDDELVACIVPALRRVCELARTGLQSHKKFTGWANDRTRWPGLLESWATAIVLTLLLRYRELLLDVRQRQVLARYRHKPAASVKGGLAWPDLQGTLRIPIRADSDSLSGISDPSPNGELAQALRSEILDRTLCDPAERPAKSGLILYGTPGTRKTTMVKELAKALRWPMITLSPPDFLSDGGLEGFETAADRVFTDLGRLKRVVILFDECEDFFRPRPSTYDDFSEDGVDTTPGDSANPAPETTHQPQSPRRDSVPETRTIGAFITAGMLPRLQDLRDARWNIFVLATNVSLDELDEAAIRPGRFDFAQDIGNPVASAQVRYAQAHRAKLSTSRRRALVEAIESVNCVMPFRAIDVAADALEKRKIQASGPEIAELIEEERDRRKPYALY